MTAFMHFIERICLAALFSTLNISAQTVTVGCAGSSGTFDYPSLSAALSAANVRDIAVSGTCTETIEIGNFEDLSIRGVPSAIITFDGNQAIATSAKILRLDNLTLGPASLGLFIRTGSVTLTNCVIRDAGVGIEVRPNSQADLTSTTIQGSDRGIELTGPGGFLFLEGPNNIQNNRIGISSEGGSIWVAGAGATIINNTYGMRLRNGSALKMNSPATFENNHIGIALISSSAQLDGSYGGGQSLQRNGVAGDSSNATILAEGNSHLDVFDAEITNNQSNGILLRDNSSMRTGNATITGNAGGGIRLLSLSTGHFYEGMRVHGNGGGDLICSLNSFAGGYRSGIGKMSCLTFSPSSETMLQ